MFSLIFVLRAQDRHATPRRKSGRARSVPARTTRKVVRQNQPPGSSRESQWREQNHDVRSGETIDSRSAAIRSLLSNRKNQVSASFACASEANRPRLPTGGRQDGVLLFHLREQKRGRVQKSLRARRIRVVCDRGQQ